MLDLTIEYDGRLAVEADFPTSIEKAAYEILVEDCERVKGRVSTLRTGGTESFLRVELIHPSIPRLAVVLCGPKAAVESAMQELDVK
jgi:hypothetical protein